MQNMRPQRKKGCWLSVLLFLLNGIKTWQPIWWTELRATFTALSSANSMCETPASQFTSLASHMGKIRCSQKSH